MAHLPVEKLKEKIICADCVSEEYLSAEIAHDGTERVCDYCGESAQSYTLEELARRIGQAFDEHFTRTRSEPDGFEWAMQKNPELNYSWEREGEQTIYAIMNAADISEDAAGDIQAIFLLDHTRTLRDARSVIWTAYTDWSGCIVSRCAFRFPAWA